MRTFTKPTPTWAGRCLLLCSSLLILVAGLADVAWSQLSGAPQTRDSTGRVLVTAEPLPASDRHPTSDVHLASEASALWIEGTATTGDFTCEAGEMEGHGNLASRRAEALLVARVRSFDCGNRRMNDDFYAAMQARQHPLIRFTLVEAEVLPDAGVSDRETPGRADAGPWSRVRARGRLVLAGTERPVDVLLQGRQLVDGRLQARGQKTLRMSDFGIEPPTALLGLVKVRDRITVHFDLVERAQDLPAASHQRPSP